MAGSSIGIPVGRESPVTTLGAGGRAVPCPSFLLFRPSNHFYLNSPSLELNIDIWMMTVGAAIIQITAQIPEDAHWSECG